MQVEKQKIPSKMHKGGMPQLYPFDNMAVGDSFFVTGKKGADLSGSLTHWNKKLAPAKFVTRLYDAKGERQSKYGELGVRVFRVK